VLAQSARAVASVDTGDPTPAADWLSRFGIGGQVDLRRGTFADVVPALGRFDMVFVDGTHDAPNVRADLDLALAALAPGGVVACHDYPDPDWPDVRRVVDEVAARAGLRRVRQSDYLGVFTAPGPAHPAASSAGATSAAARR
jgi:hypothetical protein